MNQTAEIGDTIQVGDTVFVAGPAMLTKEGPMCRGCAAIESVDLCNALHLHCGGGEGESAVIFHEVVDD